MDKVYVPEETYTRHSPHGMLFAEALDHAPVAGSEDDGMTLRPRLPAALSGLAERDFRVVWIGEVISMTGT